MSIVGILNCLLPNIRYSSKLYPKRGKSFHKRRPVNTSNECGFISGWGTYPNCKRIQKQKRSLNLTQPSTMSSFAEGKVRLETQMDRSIEKGSLAVTRNYCGGFNKLAKGREGKSSLNSLSEFYPTLLWAFAFAAKTATTEPTRQEKYAREFLSVASRPKT